MAKKHIVLIHENTRAEEAARKTLTFLGQYKHGGDLYGDLGLARNWTAYKRERVKLGLPGIY